ncbi:hypothetical protein [Streptomyces exfoliatus]|uniref:hypothetical protein n=1 Tax=Streptomyces exfoliatus TaxID=1905 RepID=UPI0004635BC7|nr:hypothetical protein [Streptomyces exfoliatus]
MAAESLHPVLPDRRLAAGVARLAVCHQGRYSVETVQRLIADSFEQLAANAHIRTHLVVSTDACPVVPGHRYLDWPVPDPDSAPIAVVRSIRDAIDARITTLLDALPST